MNAAKMAINPGMMLITKTMPNWEASDGASLATYPIVANMVPITNKPVHLPIFGKK